MLCILVKPQRFPIIGTTQYEDNRTDFVSDFKLEQRLRQNGSEPFDGVKLPQPSSALSAMYVYTSPTVHPLVIEQNTRNIKE